LSKRFPCSTSAQSRKVLGETSLFHQIGESLLSPDVFASSKSISSKLFLKQVNFPIFSAPVSPPLACKIRARLKEREREWINLVTRGCIGNRIFDALSTPSRQCATLKLLPRVYVWVDFLFLSRRPNTTRRGCCGLISALLMQFRLWLPRARGWFSRSSPQRAQINGNEDKRLPLRNSRHDLQSLLLPLCGQKFL
jgi:hypothetical protein